MCYTTHRCGNSECNEYLLWVLTDPYGRGWKQERLYKRALSRGLQPEGLWPTTWQIRRKSVSPDELGLAHQPEPSGRISYQAVFWITDRGTITGVGHGMDDPVNQ